MVKLKRSPEDRNDWTTRSEHKNKLIPLFALGSQHAPYDFVVASDTEGIKGAFVINAFLGGAPIHLIALHGI